jgi:hypothetical protein
MSSIGYCICFLKALSPSAPYSTIAFSKVATSHSLYMPYPPILHFDHVLSFLLCSTADSIHGTTVANIGKQATLGTNFDGVILSFA